MKTIRLTTKRALVYPIYQRSSRLFMPDTALDVRATKLFYVLGTSPDIKEFKKGDWIVYQSYSSGPQPIGDGSFVISDTDKTVLAVISGTPEEGSIERINGG